MQLSVSAVSLTLMTECVWQWQKIAMYTSCHDQTAQQLLHVHICYTVSKIKTQVNKQTSSHSILESQQFQVMIYIKEIAIILLNTLTVTEFRSTQSATDTFAAKGSQY